MTANKVPLTGEDLRLVADIGILGAEAGQSGTARALFEALRVLLPDSNLPWIGLALADLGAEKPENAARLLREEALPRHPDDPEVTAFLGLALQCAGRDPEAHKLLSALVEKEDANAPHTKLAARLLALNKTGASPAMLMPRWSDFAKDKVGEKVSTNAETKASEKANV